MKTFKYDLDQAVKLKKSGELGSIVGRMDQLLGEDQYRICYVDADGRQVIDWWEEHLIDAA